MDKKKAGYGLFLERAASLGGTESLSSLADRQTEREPEARTNPPSDMGSSYPAPVRSGVRAENEFGVFERESNRAIVLLFRICAEVESMAHVFEGLDDEHFLKHMKMTYGHVFSEFLASEYQAAREVEKSSSLVDATWGPMYRKFCWTSARRDSASQR